ncbi:transposase domain-containing protein [Kitasatospora purpeofusca]|uniref:transposase domain-containing protein n=1 Tax=Kitasatospora purpeofusca TaxID=67352 RepID=UPI0037F4BD2A
MASGSVERQGPVVRPGGVSVGDLVAAVPRRMIEEAVDACGLDGPAPDGELPLHLTAYLVMALCLFPDEPVEDVARTVVAELSRLDGVPGVTAGPLTASGISRARRRLGRDVLRETFYRVAQPVVSPGARLGGQRLMAVEGFGLDVPDSAGNAAEFGPDTAGRSRPGTTPGARVVAVVDCGSRAVVDAEVGPRHHGEEAMTVALLATASSDWVLLGDRSRYTFATFGAAARIGAATCWRVPPRVPLPVLQALPDDSYLSVLVDPDLPACERAKCLLEAWSGVKPDPDSAHPVRVVVDGDADRLVATFRDPEEVTAAELADAHRQWRRQSATDSGPCSVLRGPGGVRSVDPDLVHQEIWAHLLAEYAVNSTTWA